MSVNNEIEHLKNRLDIVEKQLSKLLKNQNQNQEEEDSNEIKIKNNFIEKYNVDFTHINNLEVIASYECTQDKMDEYSSFSNGKFKLSYDFIKDNNKPISVTYTGEFEKSQTYYNRYEPDVNFETDLTVSPNIHYVYNKDEMIVCKEDDEDNQKWCDLINKVLDDIICEVDNFSYILDDLTDSGKIVIKN